MLALNVARMDISRLPRQMLSSWIENKRPIGRPKLTYGATIKKALNHFNLTGKTGWSPLAHSCVQPKTVEIVDLS